MGSSCTSAGPVTLFPPLLRFQLVFAACAGTSCTIHPRIPVRARRQGVAARPFPHQLQQDSQPQSYLAVLALYFTVASRPALASPAAQAHSTAGRSSDGRRHNGQAGVPRRHPGAAEPHRSTAGCLHGRACDAGPLQGPRGSLSPAACTRAGAPPPLRRRLEGVDLPAQVSNPFSLGQRRGMAGGVGNLKRFAASGQHLQGHAAAGVPSGWPGYVGCRHPAGAGFTSLGQYASSPKQPPYMVASTHPTGPAP
jgi:hypothetical protein